MNLIPADPTLSGKPARAKQPAKAPAATTSGANAGDSTLSTTIASSAPAPAAPVISSSPLATPTLTAGVASVTHLNEKLSEYMNAADLKKVKEAYRFSDEMHLGQVRKSGEPYISHPIAVAEICADWKLDAQAIMAALLHDVMEDQDVKKEELIERFGAPVANLVDGLSKLEKIEFQSQIEAQAENFRKMLLAMASDVRVILIKLADRLHNMRTMEVMAPAKKARISSETMEVYVPIAHRLGLNNIYRELQDLSFSHLYPLRYRTLAKAVKAARGNRREVVKKILESVTNTLSMAHIEARCTAARRRCTASTRRCAASTCRSRRCSTCTASAWWSTASPTATWRWAPCTRCTSRCRASSRTTSRSASSTATSRCTRP